MQRFLPSEFGVDPAKMGHALEPGRVTFDEKMEIRRAIEEANIPHTYVSANCFAAYFAANLSQMRTLLPPKKKVHVYGDGNVKGKHKHLYSNRKDMIFSGLFWKHALIFKVFPTLDVQNRLFSED